MNDLFTLFGMLDEIKGLGCQWCLIDNPNKFVNNNSDIDILFDKSKKRALCKILRSHGWRFEQELKHPKSRLIAKKYFKEFGQVQLDFQFRLTIFNGFRQYYLDIPYSRENFKSIPFLDSCSYLKYLAVKDSILKKEQRDISWVQKEYQDVYQCQFKQKLNIEASQDKSKIPFYFNLILNRLFKRNPALIVQLLGVDGSGKGTYGDYIHKELNRKKFNVSTLYLGHADYQWGLFRKFNKYRVASNTAYLRQMFRLIYWLGLPIEILLRLVFTPQSDILVIDRNPLFEGSNDPWYSRFIKFGIKIICPMPNLTLFFTGDMKEIYYRKKEHSIETLIKKNQSISNELMREKIDFFSIDTSRELSIVKTEIIELIENEI